MISIITDKTLTRLDSEYINVTQRLVIIRHMNCILLVSSLVLPCAFSLLWWGKRFSSVGFQCYGFVSLVFVLTAIFTVVCFL